MHVPDVVLVRYGEITLKDSWTRGSWERILAANVGHDLREAGIEHGIVRERGRIFVRTDDPRAGKLISNVFGVVSTSPAYEVKPDIEEISRMAVSLARDVEPASFAIRPRRSGGPISSEALGIEVGRAVQLATGARVDLGHPDLEIYVEARAKRALVFRDVIKGVGGLPLGSQARMLALISGGIDSPVAAWAMMRRGSPVSFLHFDARPYADALDQTVRSVEALRRWTSGRKLNLITVANAKGIGLISSRHPRATCILCRRLMYRIATEVMRLEGAAGIVTGYSLGQVASQTAENIMAEQVGINAPIYHPLIAMDKSEIMELARKIGTYGATEDTKSCTAVHPKPITKAKLQEMLEIEAQLGLEELALELVEDREVIRI